MIPQFSQYLLFIIKFFAIIGGFIYLIFATIVVKQVSTMTKNVQDVFNVVLTIFSYVHLAFSILLILLTLIIL